MFAAAGVRASVYLRTRARPALVLLAHHVLLRPMTSPVTSLFQTQGLATVELRMDPKNVWQAALGELQLSLQRSVYDNWLRDTAFVAYEDGCYIIAVKTAYAQEWLSKRMKSMIKQRLERLSGRSVDVRFVVRPDSVITPETEQRDAPLLADYGEERGRYHSPAVRSTSSLSSDMTFDSYIEGDGNRFAHAAAQAVVQDPGKHYNPLFLYGGVGLGKTHLLHAVGNGAAQNGLAVRYVTTETFTNDLIEAIRTKSNVAFRQTYREVDVLLIDDIQFIQGKESTKSEFFHTFNSLYASNKQIVIASDRPPKLLTKLEDRLRSRFDGGLIADLQPPDLEHRIAILRSKAYDKGLVVPDEVIRYIAEQFNSNVRELQGALNRLTAHSRLHFTPLDMSLAHEVLGPIDLPLDDDPRAIIQAVADEFRVTVAELEGPRRPRRIVVPRQVAMYLLREVAQLSFPQIGELLGGRDHTTAMHGNEKINGKLEIDTELRTHIESVRIRLSQ